MVGTAACQSPAPDSAEAPGDTVLARTDTGRAAVSDSTSRGGLPLLTIMQQLSADMSGFTYALWLEDYQQMAAYADDIVKHPNMTPEEVQRIKAELGSEMDGFLAADSVVHHGALRLQEAAEARDLDLILKRLNELQRGCVSCHTQYREQLRSNEPAPNEARP